MFKSLRFKLTLLTVGIIIILFTFFSAILYMQILYNSERGTDFGLHKITEEIIAQRIIDFPDRPPKKQGETEWTDKSQMLLPARPNFFFVKMDSSGSPAYISRGLTIEYESLQKLAALTLASQTEEGTISFEDTEFAYLRTELPDENGQLIVYNDLRNQNENMVVLLRHLIITGILSALVAWLVIYQLAKYVIRPIERAVEQQQHFVSDASHELRTPLTIIQTNLDIISGAPPEETIADNHHWLHNIQAETSRMTELINTLLFLARADANRQLLEKEYFPLRPVIDGVLDAFAPVAEQHAVSLSSALSDKLTALGDATRLQQVLTILLDNAVRHTPAGGSVNITAAADKTHLVIKVADTGEGIAAKHLDKIFNRFYQVDESRHNGGSGLGLSLAKWIIDKHGGEIFAASTVGKGTTFTIKLPQA